MVMNEVNTIAAIATPVSSGGISIIRISGESALTMGDSFFQFRKGTKKLSETKSHTVSYGYIVKDGDKVDEVLALVMKGPNSYTGEDVLEIQCHGGILVTRRILEIILERGARPAEPGEFTKRAFLNGRLDLSQAEAVADLIQAKNDLALKSSVGQLSGNISTHIKKVRDKIIYQIAFIESALDDPEHISIDGYGDKLLEVIDEVEAELTALVSTHGQGRILNEGIKTVILGRPNAGKSSLLNKLLGEERAIVTEVAGTTRDTLEESIILDGVQLNIIDTAGIRMTDDIVEKIGVKKAVDTALDSDLILYVLDSSVALNQDDYEIMKMIKGRKCLVLLNKSDLDGIVKAEEIQILTGIQPILTSITEDIGITDLRNGIKQLFFAGEINFNDEVIITNVRHEKALKDSLNSLKLVKSSIRDGMPEDFYSIDLMDAYESLGFIIGEALEEDLVNQIFSKFCMGK